jgi:hypothetical protein
MPHVLYRIARKGRRMSIRDRQKTYTPRVPASSYPIEYTRSRKEALCGFELLATDVYSMSWTRAMVLVSML